jgi:hypothetical protein
VKGELIIWAALQSKWEVKDLVTGYLTIWHLPVESWLGGPFLLLTREDGLMAKEIDLIEWQIWSHGASNLLATGYVGCLPDQGHQSEHESKGHMCKHFPVAFSLYVSPSRAFAMVSTPTAWMPCVSDAQPPALRFCHGQQFLAYIAIRTDCSSQTCRVLSVASSLRIQGYQLEKGSSSHMRKN